MRTSSEDPSNNTHNNNYYTRFINGLPFFFYFHKMFHASQLYFLVLNDIYEPHIHVARVFSIEKPKKIQICNEKQ